MIKNTLPLLLFSLLLTAHAVASDDSRFHYQTIQHQEIEKDINICMWAMTNDFDHTIYDVSLFKSGRIDDGNEANNISQIRLTKRHDSAAAQKSQQIHEAWLEVDSLFETDAVFDTRAIAIGLETETDYVINLPEKEFHLMMLSIGHSGFKLNVVPEDNDEAILYYFHPPTDGNDVLKYRECLNSIPKIDEID